MKKRIRKTGEIVDVISYYNCYCSERDTTDSVSYIDSKGVEHRNERGLNLWWDFEDVEEVLSTDIDWNQRRYEIAKEAVRGVALNEDTFSNVEIKTTVKNALKFADALIAELKKGGEK